MQKDYWQMSEEELTKLAETYHIPLRANNT